MKARKAFTLVELLVVIAIVAVLIAILLPALRKAREQAMNIMCMSNMRTMGTALIMYRGENRGFFPMTFMVYLDPPASFYNRTFPYRLWKYIGKYGTARRPGDGTQLDPTYFPSRRHVFYCPTADILTRSSFPRPAGPTQVWYDGGPPGATDATIATYAYNTQLGYSDTSYLAYAPNTYSYRWLKPKRFVKVESRAYVLIDSGGVTGSYAGGLFGSPRCDYSFYWWGAPHMDGTNCLMADGHAEHFHREDIEYNLMPTGGPSGDKFFHLWDFPTWLSSDSPLVR